MYVPRVVKAEECSSSWEEGSCAVGKTVAPG